MNSEPTFRRSSYCADGTCVEIAESATGEVLLRDGKQPAAQVLTFSADAWTEFLDATAAGEFGPCASPS